MRTPLYYFKKTISGMVLMLRYRVPDNNPGDWIYKYRKARESEAQDILCMLMRKENEK